MNHDCGKFTYEYVRIYVSEEPEDKGRWILDVDNQSGFYLDYCPFCGERLVSKT